MVEFFCQDCIAAMPAAKFWLVFLFASGIAIASLLGAKSSFVKARLIEDTPTSLIRSASQGFVELVGLAITRGEPLAAPLTGEPCLWWRFKIERHQKSGKSSSWKTVEKGTSDADFFMDDGSGVCRIDPAGADISCLHKRVWYGHSSRPATATIPVKLGFFDKLKPFLGSGRYRYTQFLIRDGDPLYLLGHFVSDASGNRTLTVDQVAANLVREWKQDFDNLLVKFDRDGNGLLDEAEWQQVRDAAKKAALKQQQSEAGSAVEHSVTRPEDRGLPYLIGSHGQETLSQKFKWWAAASATAFLASGAFASWLASGRL
jgi:hypothetical protein